MTMIGSVRTRLDDGPAALIRDARRRAGITQAELARRLGTTQSVVSRWERGHDAPRVDTLVEILRACGFESDLVLRPRDTGVDRAQIRNRLRRTPADRLREVQALTDFVRAARRVS
jgi:transcriptional regulator with XRE-family HTH domain